MMKINKWTLGLAAVGLVTLPAALQAEERMSALQTALSSTTISGYVDAGAQWAIGTTKNGPPPGYAFNTPDKQDGFNLNAVNVTIEKALDPQDNWAAGYKIDMIYGPNAVAWNPSYVNGSANSSDFALKQAYVALRAPLGNGLDFKLGTFDSVVGYEVFHAGSNPNYTRTYGYTSEPTQHTGLLASYQFCKEFGVAGGVANTATPGINTRSWLSNPNKSETDKTYLGGVTISAPESWGWVSGSTLYGGVVSGWNSGADNGQTWYYAGATLNTPVTGLKVGACYDYNSMNGSAASLNPTKTWFNAVAGYVSYKATEKLSLHARAEYVWMDDQLVIVNDPGAGVMGNGLASSIFAVTGTIQYDLWANVISRIEFRWDHACDGTTPYFSNDENAFLLAANVIYKF
jgi:hypothetical protein